MKARHKASLLTATRKYLAHRFNVWERTVSTLFNTWVRFMSCFTVHSSGFSRGEIAPGTSSSFSFTFYVFFFHRHPATFDFAVRHVCGPYIPPWIVHEANFAGKKFLQRVAMKRKILALSLHRQTARKKLLRAKNHQPPPSTSLTFLMVHA